MAKLDKITVSETAVYAAGLDDDARTPGVEAVRKKKGRGYTWVFIGERSDLQRIANAMFDYMDPRDLGELLSASERAACKRAWKSLKKQGYRGK